MIPRKRRCRTINAVTNSNILLFYGILTQPVTVAIRIGKTSKRLHNAIEGNLTLRSFFSVNTLDRNPNNAPKVLFVGNSSHNVNLKIYFFSTQPARICIYIVGTKSG